MSSSKTIFIAADHAAYELKNHLVKYLSDQGYQVENLGTNNADSVNYPNYAHQLSKLVLEQAARGILLCGSGIGMSIAANRHPGIRAALCHSPDYAKLSREHNDSNVLVLGARFTNQQLAQEIVDTWLGTEFAGGRHADRLKLIDNN